MTKTVQLEEDTWGSLVTLKYEKKLGSIDAAVKLLLKGAEKR